MQPRSAESFWAISSLAKSLRREYLFIANEQSSFISLHEAYEQNSCKTLQIAWICAHQRQILNNLILAKPESGPSISCQRANMLENTKFIDIHQCKVIKYPQIIGIVELLNYLHESPGILAHCLSIADSKDVSANQIDTVISFIIHGLYGSVIHPKDAEMIIKLLQVLIEVQIVISDNPRRLLRAGSSSFTRLYQEYHESTFAAKIFLKAILFEPIMSVLMEDERKLEIDPHKIIAVQSMTENIKMFGEDTSSEYLENLQRYRKKTIDRLCAHVSRFITSISDNWCLFPSTLRWLSQSMCHFLTQAKLSKEDINIILTDMIFTNFICPAILSPNIYGIIDAPISDNTRFNLIQIGQVLQTLALIEHQPIDEKQEDLFKKFDSSCISDLLNQLHQNGFTGNFENSSMTQHQSMACNKLVLATLGELSACTNLLKTTLEQEGLPFSSDEKHKLKQMLDQLPDLTEIIPGNHNLSNDIISSSAKPKSKLKSRMSKTRSLNNSPFHYSGESDKKTNVCNNNNINDLNIVFIIPLTMNDDGKLLTEEELLNNIPGEISTKDLTEPYVEQINLQNNQNKLANTERNEREKHKTFSMPHDDASIGNTSDNLEAVSEAHSNHSVASSLELEEADQNDNDNLSDMISANVSGRGTPNISGRDTPSSQVTEGGGEVQQFATPQMTKILNKTRSDIEDKFCKFEIKKLIEGDETISIISDTWSTDVLASDSEAMEANDRNFSTPLIPATPLMPGDHNYNPLTSSFGQLRISNVDSETQSESAWSTDAVMDTDDNQSVTTRSDTTDSVAREQEVPIGLSNHSLDSSLYTSRVPNLRGLDTNSNASLNNQDDPSQSMTSEHVSIGDIPVTIGRHYPNCLQPSSLPTRQSSTDSYNSNSGSESKARSSGSDSNDNNTKMHSIDKTGNQKMHTSRDKNYNNAKCIDHNDLGSAIDEVKSSNKGSTTNSSSRMSSTALNPFSDAADYNFPPTNNNNNNNNNTNNNNNNNNQNNSTTNNSVHQSIIDQFSNTIDDELSSVEHRRLSSEHRNAKFDSRRNGMMDVLGNFSNSFNFAEEYLQRDFQFLNANNSAQIADELRNHRSTIPTMVHDPRTNLSNLTSPCLIKMTQTANKESPPNSANTDACFLAQNADQQRKSSDLKCSSSNSSVAKFTGKPTGTIPKSISFDSSADKASRNNSVNISVADASRSSDGLKTHSGFFNKIKLGFKNRRSINVNNKLRFSYNNNGHIIAINSSDGFSTNPCIANDVMIANETTEDILAKYRRKTSTSSETAASDSTSNNSSSNKSKNGDIDRRKVVQIAPEYSTTFAIAKRKLRLVLSSTEIFSCDFEQYTANTAAPLLMYLRILQAQALSNHNLQQLSCISELLRCLQSLNGESQQLLLKELQNDILIRQAYIQYLISCRQTLLSSIDNLTSFKSHLQQESKESIRHIIMMCVKMFLEKREQIVQTFHNEFVEITVVDEKIDFLQEFLNSLMDDLRADAVLSCMTDWQISEARHCMECVLLHRLYLFVMFPNDDGDISRDQVLYEHIGRLSKSITPTHKHLCISTAYLNEAPWYYAQRQLSYISAYKAPYEKVECVIKCIKSLLSLLSMASDRTVAADDIIPVLIYVIIQANPPNMLSTIEYVNCFIGDKLSGENQYWWTQFCSAITFIKTMDYCE